MIVSALTVEFCAAAFDPNIYNNTDWVDSGNVNLISAHEGSISRFGDTFYWYGTSYASNPTGRTGRDAQWDGFKVYSSSDLVNWTDQGWAVQKPAWGWLAKYTAHTPRVIYNDTTGKYVMWFHYFFAYNSGALSPASMAMAADSNSPTGPFQIVAMRETGGPYGFATDMNLFKDDDPNGTAYLIYEDGAGDIRVDKLSADYLSSTKQSVVAIGSVAGNEHEVPAMIKYRGKYIVAASGVNGWGASETDYAVADSPMGPYGQVRQMSQSNTWSSRFSNFVYVNESNKLFALCDAWWNPNPSDLDESRYFWLPVAFNANTETAVMEYRAQWNPWQMPADFNGDGAITFRDFAILCQSWLECNLDPPDFCP